MDINRNMLRSAQIAFYLQSYNIEHMGGGLGM